MFGLCACDRAHRVAALLDDPEFVFVLDFDFAAASPLGANFDDIVVADGAFVRHVEADDDEKDAVFFELGVTHSRRAEEFGSAHFHPRNVAGVMCDAHRVALAVADAELEGVVADGGGGLSHGEL